MPVITETTMKYNWMFFLLAICLCVLNISLVAAQHRVSGLLVDEKEKPLQGATILFMRGDSLAAGGMSDMKGSFNIEGLPGERYQIRFSLIGYKTAERILDVKADQKLGMICLEEEVYALNGVTVTGDKRNLIDMQASGSTFRISDKLRNEAHNIYQALREIPLLNVNETERKISMVDGSAPVILVNGVRRSGAEASIDPKQIEAVEVIENPSARYLSEEEVTSVLNIRMKRGVELSQSVNVYGNQTMNASYGVYGGYYQLEKSNLSFYLNGQFFYFHHDDSELTNVTSTGSLLRTSEGTRRYNASSLYLNAGGDWIASPKNYLSYSLTLVNNPANTQTDESGKQERAIDSTPFFYTSYTDNKYLMGNYALFYRRTYASDRHLELTARASHYNTSPFGWRKEESDWNSYRNEIDMDNRRMIYSAESNYDFIWPEKMAFDVGLNAYYQQVKIKESPVPFDYKEGREYLYASLRGLGKGNFSYTFSLGLDIVERSATGVRKNYVNVLPSLTLAYKPHKRGSLRLSLSRQRTSPDLSTLNPLNTSTDSLYVTMGNPYLSPELSNRAVLSYSWNKSPIYLQPSVSYTYVQDRILPSGRLDGDIYIRSYLNTSHAHIWRTSLTARINLGEYGNINITPFFSKLDFPGMAFSGKAWGANGNLYLSYKKVYLNGMFNYTSYSYTQISRTRLAPITELTVGWELPKGWSLSVSVRDNMHYNRSWVSDGNYAAYSERNFKDRHWTPMIGLSYYFRSKVQLKYRNKKKLYNNESDSFKLEVK